MLTTSAPPREPTTPPTRLRSGAPVSVLVRHLRRAGWGALAGREWQGVRSTLVAMIDRVGDNTGRGVATAEQISAGAGLSERWTRRCLQVLEEIQIISWQRGGVRAGSPEASGFRVNKARLLELIEEARPERDKAVMLRRQETADRLAQIRVPYLRSKHPAKRFRRSVHAELDASLIPIGEEPARASAPPSDPPRPPRPREEPGDAGRGLAAARARIRPMRTPDKTRQDHTGMSRTTDLRKIPLTVDPDQRPVTTLAESVPDHLAHLLDSHDRSDD